MSSKKQKKPKKKRSSKRQKLKSFEEHYEASINSLLDEFETNLSISPIASNKSISNKMYKQSEEKEIEMPDFTFSTASIATDDIPRIRDIRTDDYDDNETVSVQSSQFDNCSVSKENISQISNINSIQQSNNNNNASVNDNILFHSDSNINSKQNIIEQNEMQQLPDLPPQNINANCIQNSNSDIHSHNTQQQMQNRSNHQNIMDIPNTPHPSHQQQQFIHVSSSTQIPSMSNNNQHQQHQQQQQIHRPISQSYDFGMKYRNNNHFIQYHNNVQTQQHQNRYQQQIQTQQRHSQIQTQTQTQQQHMQQQHQRNVTNMQNVSYFAPHRLTFSGLSSIHSSSQHQSASLSKSVNAPNITQHTQSMNNPNIVNANKIDNNVNNINPDIEQGEDEDADDDDDSNLFMPITPTLSGTALRTLLSRLRQKCKSLKFKSSQQRKFIIDVRDEISNLQKSISNEKLKAYNNEQYILMLQSKENIQNLDYLRGAELNQTRQELVYMIEKMNQYKSENDKLKQQMELHKLDNVTYTKSLREEHQRLLREISQHKVLFDQRCRELKQLKQSSNNEKLEYDKKLTNVTNVKDKHNDKLHVISNQLAELRENHDNLKKKFDDVSSENENNLKLTKKLNLQIDERNENILSLQRVKDNLEQEIEALSRSNRNQNNIRNTSTKQLLNSHQYEINGIKRQITEQYEKHLENEKIQNEQLQQLLQEKTIEINRLKMSYNHTNKHNNNDDQQYGEILERLEIENNELRQKLEEIQFGGNQNVNTNINNNNSFYKISLKNESVQTDNDITNINLNQTDNTIDPYNCSVSSSSKLDEFGLLMLKTAKEEVEQLRKTNEKLIKLHNKNHFKKPHVQDQCTQTYNDNGNNANNTVNTSFMTTSTINTTNSTNTNKQQQFFDNFDNFEIFSPDTEKSDKMLINDTSIVQTTEENSFIKEFQNNT